MTNVQTSTMSEIVSPLTKEGVESKQRLSLFFPARIDVKVCNSLLIDEHAAHEHEGQDEEPECWDTEVYEH